MWYGRTLAQQITITYSSSVAEIRYEYILFRNIRNGESYYLYSLPKIVRNIMLKTVMWAEYVAHMREDKNVYVHNFIRIM
jgi:hypothetical protein